MTINETYLASRVPGASVVYFRDPDARVVVHTCVLTLVHISSRRLPLHEKHLRSAARASAQS